MTIVNTALPFIQTALHADILQLQWISNIFIMILSMTMIAAGKCADLWGRKKVFYVGVIVFAIAALGAGFSKTILMLIFFRGLQAIGASITLVVSASLLSNIFEKKDLVKAISIYGGITGFGLMIGPFLGGILISLFDWRFVFWINLPLIGVGLLACVFSFRNFSCTKQAIKIDLLGLCLLIVGLGALMYGIIKNAEMHWSSTPGWILLGSGILSLALLVILDELKKEPLLDLHIFQKPLVTLAALSCALAGIVSTVFMFFDPLYLRILRDLSPLMIGLLIAVIPAAQALISFIFERLVNHFGVTFLLFISIIAACLAILLHRLIEQNTSFYFIVLPFFLLGINWGLSNAGMMTVVNQEIGTHKVGSAIGTIATIWNLTGALILAISAAIFHMKEGTSFLPAFHSVVVFNIVIAGLILVFSIWVRKKI